MLGAGRLGFRNVVVRIEEGVSRLEFIVLEIIDKVKARGRARENRRSVRSQVGSRSQV